MRRFHRQELQRAKPLCAGGALYFLQQTLACVLEGGRVALESVRNLRNHHLRMGLVEALWSLRAVFRTEANCG